MLEKTFKQSHNYAKSKPNYACYRHHLHWLGAHHLAKASCKISVQSIEGFWAKVEKVQKMHKLCLIILVKGIGGGV